MAAVVAGAAAVAAEDAGVADAVAVGDDEDNRTTQRRKDYENKTK